MPKRTRINIKPETKICDFGDGNGERPDHLTLTLNAKADMWYSLQLCCLCPQTWALIRFYHVCLICLA